MTITWEQRIRHTGAPSRADAAEIRAWAKANGYPVSDKGRLSIEIIDAYDRENPSDTKDSLHPAR